MEAISSPPTCSGFYDYDKKSGTILWARKDDDNGIYTTPTLADNTAFYGSRKRLFAKRLDNGHDLWDGIPLTIYGGFANVYGTSSSSQRGILRKIRSARLPSTHQREKNPVAKAHPLRDQGDRARIYNEVVYLTANSNLMAFKAATGEPVFDEGHGEYIVDHPVFSDASIFLPMRDGTVSVADLKTGKRKSLRKTEFKKRREPPPHSRQSLRHGRRCPHLWRKNFHGFKAGRL